MKISHILPSHDDPVTTMQGMKWGEVGIIRNTSPFNGAYVIRLSNNGDFIILKSGFKFLFDTDHPVDILPKGTVITLIME
jgi:hypothetical protein